MITCKKCGKKIEEINAFTGERCLQCFEKDFDNLTEAEKIPQFDVSLIRRKS